MGNFYGPDMPMRKLMIRKPEMAAQPDMTEPREDGVPDDEDSELSNRQRIMYEFFELVAKKMGKWDKSGGPEGAHYVEEHPFGKNGMKCINCSFFQGGNRCEIVSGDIDPEAICKLWVIREDLIKE